jgi:hypothetical protein
MKSFLPRRITTEQSEVNSNIKGTVNPEKGMLYPAKLSDQGIKVPEMGILHPAHSTNKITAIDFGQGDALVAFNELGTHTKKSLHFPRVPGGATSSGDFIRMVEHFFNLGHDVVVESPTMGSSGAEPTQVNELCEEFPQRVLWTLSARAVKNYRMENSITSPKSYVKYEAPAVPDTQPSAHELDAEILYIIATTTPTRLKKWKINENPLQRKFTSVRPHDKRKYTGEIPDAYMERLPEYETLPVDLKELLGDGKKYSRARAMPFAMALEEEGADTRSGFEKVIGLYDHGYPSFYRRNTIVLMQNNAKKIANVEHNSDVPRDARKEAWKLTRRQVRHFYHLCNNN